MVEDYSRLHVSQSLSLGTVHLLLSWTLESTCSTACQEQFASIIYELCEENVRHFCW